MLISPNPGYSRGAKTHNSEICFFFFFFFKLGNVSSMEGETPGRIYRVFGEVTSTKTGSFKETLLRVRKIRSNFGEPSEAFIFMKLTQKI